LCVTVLAGIAAWQGGALVARGAPFALAAVGLGIVATLSGPTSHPPGPWIAPADYGSLLAYVFPVAAAVWVAPDPIAATGEVRRSSVGWVALGLGWLVQLAAIAWFTQVAPGAALIASPRIGLDGAAVPALARIGLVVGAVYAAVGSLHDGARSVRDVAAATIPALDRPGAAELAVTTTALAAIVSLRSIDGAATAWTLALLLTFTAVNTVVAIELSLGLVSFRPSTRPATVIPVIGALGSAIAMLLTHVGGALALTAAALGAVGFLLRPRRTASEHSALVTAMAEWLARRTASRFAVRAWKPSMLVPFDDADALRPALDLLVSVGLPEGAIRFLGTGAGSAADVERVVDAARARGLDADGTWVDAPPGVDPLPVALQTLRVAVFRPNLVVVRLGDPADDARVAGQVVAARDTDTGVLLIGTPPGMPVIGGRRMITLWVRSIPGRWNPLEGYEGRNLDLTLLLGYRLARRWGSQLRLVTVVTEPEHRIGAEQFLASLCALARLPPDTLRLGIVGTFEQAVDDLSNSDLDVFGLSPEPNLVRVRRLVDRARSTCLFVLDSGRESALA
ncbi:MAG: hypothetical protein ABMB14_36550, partial [Myxococcota bacterium]